MGRRELRVQLESIQPLREVVFETLRQAIIDGVLRPGERLMEVQLAEEMGVSRTPVREAIRKLELEGFVIMVPRKGAYVADFSVKDIADVFEIRAALEGLAAGLAAERITDAELENLERALVRVGECVQTGDIEALVAADTEFHDILYRASRNQRLAQIISNLREQIQRYRKVSLAHPGRSRNTIEEHKKIVEAVADRNAALAESLAQDHIENAENSMMEALKASGEMVQREA